MDLVNVVELSGNCSKVRDLKSSGFIKIKYSLDSFLRVTF
jgi:hypothetical protein